MKNILLASLCIFILASCHRKTVATKTTTTTTTNPKNAPVKTEKPDESNTTTTVDSANTTEPVNVAQPIIVVDGKGNMIAAEKLPQGAQPLSSSYARAFTPAETKNLAYRFKYIPPRILYVPDNLAKTTGGRSSYVYKNKFYYWKKSNGYYYLDENYYK